MTGWLWATRTLRNPRYATKAARDKSCLDFVFNPLLPSAHGLMLNASALTTATTTTASYIDLTFLCAYPLIDDKLCCNIVEVAVESTSQRRELSKSRCQKSLVI